MRKSNIHQCSYCGNSVKRQKVKARNGEICKNIFCNKDCYLSFVRQDRSSNGECINCGKEIFAKGLKKRKYCSHDCRLSHGIKKCLTNCISCGAVFSAIKFRKTSGKSYYAKVTGRKVCSQECENQNYREDPVRKAKISKAFKGSNHPNWNGGSGRRGFRGHDWLSISEEIRKAAGYKCESCGLSQQENGRKLDVNHKIPFSQWTNKVKANEKINLEALCRSCHMKIEWKYRKENEMQMLLGLFA